MHTMYCHISPLFFEFLVKMKEKIVLCILLYVVDQRLKGQTPDLERRSQGKRARKYSTLKLSSSCSLSLELWALI